MHERISMALRRQYHAERDEDFEMDTHAGTPPRHGLAMRQSRTSARPAAKQNKERANTD